MPNLSCSARPRLLLLWPHKRPTEPARLWTLPSSSSYRFIVKWQTVSGTSPTCRLWWRLRWTNGTTYNEILSFANLTTSGQGRQMLIRPYWDWAMWPRPLQQLAGHGRTWRPAPCEQRGRSTRPSSKFAGSPAGLHRPLFPVPVLGIRRT